MHSQLSTQGSRVATSNIIASNVQMDAHSVFGTVQMGDG